MRATAAANEGRAAYRTNNYDLALQAYDNALRIWPGNWLDKEIALARSGQAWKLGKESWGRGEWGNVVEYYSRALRLCGGFCGAEYRSSLNTDIARGRAYQSADSAKAAWNRKDWKAAISYYEEVLRRCASYCDVKYRNEIRSWMEQANSQREHENTQKQVDGAINAAQRRNPPLALQFAPSEGCIFGTGCTGKNASSVVDDNKSLPAIDLKSDIQKLSSGAKSSEEAAKHNDPVLAKRESGCQLNDRGCKETDAVVVPNVDGRAPAVTKLLAHIPPTANEAINKDPELKARIEKNIAWFQRREVDKLATESMLGNVQKKIESRSGDMTVLSAQKLQLRDELNRIKSDQKTSEDDIKRALVNRGLRWDESPPQNVETKP